MNSDEIRMFRLMLKKDYSFIIYKIEDLNTLIEELYHKMSGLKAINYENDKGTTNQQAIEQYKLSLSEDIAILEKEKEIYQMKLDKIEEVLNKLCESDREMFILKYLKHKTYYQIGKIYYLSPSAVTKRMSKVLESV